MSEQESLRLTVTCATPRATRAFGALFARILTPGDVVVLSGGLGAGKTTFVQGVVAELGGGEEVTSPTFVLCHLYESDPPIAHVDCWRFNDPTELVDLALEEILDDGGVVLIEWGELAADQLSGSKAHIEFTTTNDSSDDEVASSADGAPVRPRRIAVGGDAAWAARLSRLSQAVGGLDELIVEEVLR